MYFLIFEIIIRCDLSVFLQIVSKLTVPLDGYHIQIRDLSDSNSNNKDNRDPIQQNMFLIEIWIQFKSI